MLTGDIRSQVDRIWDTFWTGGISNPLEVIEQLTYLLFIKRLDELHTRRESKANRTGQPIEKPIFSKKQQHLRWKNFQNLDPKTIYKIVDEEVFPFIRGLGTDDSAFAKHMESARLSLPPEKAGLLAKVVDMLQKVPMDDKDTKGDLYEYLLSKLTTAGQNGQFRTPRHIIKMMARRLANDLEELYVLGDLLGPAAIEADIKGAGETAKYVKDSYLALGDGWIRRADSAHVYDASGANIGLSIFSAMLRQMPTKFRRNKKDMRFYLSSDLAQIYIEKLATRATALGDAAAAGGTHTPYGVQIVEVPLLPFLVPVVEHVVLPSTTAVSLRYAPIQDVVVSTSTLTYETPETAFISGTDYNLDLAAGTIARDAGGSIGDGDTVKVTYNSNPQALLTHYMNFIVAIGRDIRIEKDRDIYKSVNQYAITCKVDTQFEETDAVVKAQNIGQGI